MRLSLDTNVLAYAEGIVPADIEKQAQALALIRPAESHDFVIARQALAELYRLLVRRVGLAPSESADRVRIWAARAELVDTDEAVFEMALHLASAHRLQIFDAIILAAAVEARCDLLLTEDLQDGFAWRGVVVCNPFGPDPDPRIAALMKRRA